MKFRKIVWTVVIACVLLPMITFQNKFTSFEFNRPSKILSSSTFTSKKIPSTVNQWNDTELKTSDFITSTIIDTDLHKVPFLELRKKKMAVVDDSLIIADDVTSPIMLYQYNSQSLELQASLELPPGCVASFLDNKIYIIYSNRVEIYDKRFYLLSEIENSSFSLIDAVCAEEQDILLVAETGGQELNYLIKLDQSDLAKQQINSEERQLEKISEVPERIQFKKVFPHDDVRDISIMDDLYGKNQYNHYGTVFKEGDYDPGDIPTLRYNKGTVFKGSEALADAILENGKNPGLGIKHLHEQGITGRGVNVAIIDTTLFLNHPEFAGKILEYHDLGIESPEIGSMPTPLFGLHTTIMVMIPRM